jgi:nucleotide-binding universal stress UspA family protein
MEHIVVGVDGSPQGDHAVAWAVREAQLRPATVDVVHCYVVHARGAVMHVPDQERAEARLHQIVERNRHVLDRVKWSADTVGVFGAISAGLVDMGEDAALIVVGSRGAGGVGRLGLGSTGYRVAAHATTPVAVVRGDAVAEPSDPREVVVGVDGSDAARRALHWAADEAARRDVPLVAVHAVHSGVDAATLARMSTDHRNQVLERSQAAGDELLRSVMGEVDTGERAVTHVSERGAPTRVLLSHSGPDRLLVLGTHGRGAVGRMVFGSVSRRCLHDADGPVVVVP